MAEIVNAGHNFPLLVRLGEVKGIVVRGERLGDNPTARYESIHFDLMQGDMLLLYTDGVTEYLNAAGAEYGEKRLRMRFFVHTGAFFAVDRARIFAGDGFFAKKPV